ncbi:unnamed protein product [Calypogeia fissa]
MTTCVINPLMMGAIPRQTYQEHGGAKFMNDTDLIDEMKKQVQDSSYWSPTIPPTQALPAATTERSSRSALRALLQQPPPLSVVPSDSRLEPDTFSNVDIQPSWSPYPDHEVSYKTPNSLTEPKPFSQQYDDTPQHHQVGHHGFEMQPPPTVSNPYHDHANCSDHQSGLRQTQPAIIGGVHFKQEQSDELELLHQRQALQTERAARPVADFPVGSPRTPGSSLPKEFEKLQMMAFAQKQMREQMKTRLERNRSFDKKSQPSPPKREGGSKLKFGITADGIPNGPDNHPMLHSPQPQPQQQQQSLFSRGFLPTANQLHDQDMHTSNCRGSPGNSFSMETKINVEDTEALVIRQFQEKVFQLDMSTRLGFQESLYRLARSARERQDSTRTSAEPDFAGMMDMDLDSCNRPTSRPQSRVHIETQTNPVDRNLVNMLFFPLRLPGLQSPTDHLSWSRARAAAAARNQGNCIWSTPSPSENKIRKGFTHMQQLQAQFHIRDRGSGAAAAAMEEPTSRTVTTPHMKWTGAPHLADYSSPPPGSSPVDPSMLNNRQAADLNLTYRAPVANTATRQQRQGGVVHSSTTQPVDIRAPRRCDSQSSMASDLSNSPSHGGHMYNFNNVGFHGPSSYSSQDGGSFVSEGQHHMELAAGNHHHGMEQQQQQQHQHTNKSFATMNMNDDILGAALSIQNRAGEVNHMDRFHLQGPPSSNAKNVTVGFPPMLYEDGSHSFEGESLGRILGNNNSASTTGMSIFDQRGPTVLRNMARVGYTRSSEFFKLD